MPTDVYQDPLVGRYTERRMQEIFSEDNKFRTWRQCWTALAEAEMEIGLKRITPEMIAEMREHQNDINYDDARRIEKETRHDVMAHAKAYGIQCPKAAGIIHLGATSMEVDDNTVMLQMRDAAQIILENTVNTLYNLKGTAEKHKGLVCLGFTHYQAAQPTTVGKRMTLYMQDLLLNLAQLENAQSLLMLCRGAKGATGTQASFLELFDGDYEKVRRMELLFCEKLGFTGAYPATGQTYTREIETEAIKALAGIASSAHKFGLDLRLLANMKEAEEPFEKSQIGSSAMAYKRNPMRSERMCGMSRILMNMPPIFDMTHATQILERSLDDSVVRRMEIPRGFLLANAILTLYQNITNEMVFYPAQIKKRLDAELPFMATEAILMDMVQRGGDRQELHEVIREHSVEAGKRVKQEGAENDLFDRLANDSRFPADAGYFKGLLDNPARFAGAAEKQTEEFLLEHVNPVLEKYSGLIGKSKGDVRV